MKEFENARIEVIRFNDEDIITTSTPTPCDWNCKTVCSQRDCSDVCIGVYSN